MNFKVAKVLVSLFFLGGSFFPISFIVENSSISLAGKAWALSSKSMPLTSNIFVDIAKQQNPAVVSVSMKAKPRKTMRKDRNRRRPQQREEFRDFYDKFFKQQPGPREDRTPRQGGAGSGFIIDADGYILTNNHVVEGADDLIVSLDGDKEYTASLVGTDPKTDLALIKINREDGDNTPFPYLLMGDSDKLEVGEWVVAIGNPFGLSHTVTVGVVSAKGRNIGAGAYDEFIQTDASINPGNSGGPLINIKGEVIGINTAIISGGGPGGGNVGIGFAIPVNMAKSILTDLREKGKVTRGWLGVMIQKITPDLAKSFSLADKKGALVGDVIPEGPAAKAGIKRGDVIVKFNGQEVTNMEQLPKIVARTNPDTDVNVVVVRDGKSMTLNVHIDVLKDSEQKIARGEATEDPLGMQGQDITPELAQSLNLDSEDGVLVSDVTLGLSAAEAGIKRGDVISEIDRKPIRDLSEYNNSLGAIKKGRTVLFLIRRGGSTIYIAVKIK
jgi:serine protease Do